jgi:hypothetical protein
MAVVCSPLRASTTDRSDAIARSVTLHARVAAVAAGASGRVLRHI